MTMIVHDPLIGFAGLGLVAGGDCGAAGDCGVVGFFTVGGGASGNGAPFC